MHARQQGEIPEQSEADHVRQQRLHARAVQPVEQRQHRRRAAQRRKVQPLGIEQRDDRHRAHVVDDRHRGEEQLERRRRAIPEQRQHADGESDVGRGRYGPAIGQVRPRRRHQQIDDRGENHARRRRQHRQPAPVPGGQATVEKFPLDLQPDDQEEDRHQPIIDPQMDRHRPKLGRQRRPDLRMHQIMIEMPRRRQVGQHHGQRRRQNEQDRAARFPRQEMPESRRWALQHTQIIPLMIMQGVGERGR